MAKDPAFLFYPGDFSTGTQFFTDDQVGKYVRLLMAQHQLGHLEEKHMIFICKSYDKDIFSKFDKDSLGLYYNKRLEDEIVKRKKYTESRGKNRSSKNIISNSYDEHMENKNKDIYIVSNTINYKDEFFKNFPGGLEINEMARTLKTTIEILLIQVENFKPYANTEYISYGKAVDHFRNWHRNNPPKDNSKPKMVY